MLTMFNCGQGDSMLLHPSGGCYWSEIPLLIDAGPVGFLPPLNGFNEVDLLLTHSHDDHIGGALNISAKIRTLFLPAYFPEVVKIAKYFARKSPSNLLANAISRVGSMSFNNIEVLYEGCKFKECAHTEIFNPPLDPRVAMNYEVLLNEQIRGRIDDFSLENLGGSPSEINESQAFEDYDIQYPDGYQGLNFIYIFLYLMQSYSVRIQDINEAFNTVIKYDANKISVVFKYENRFLDVLFTGDADKSVFNRLIKKGSILNSEILKVPHHGSKYNLTAKILASINPSVALVSHGGKHGHPHTNVIQMLQSKCGVSKVYFTNHVIKGQNTIVGSYAGTIPNYPVTIV